MAKLDRLTRSVADMATLVRDYFGERAGKSLFSVADSIDTRTAAGRMVLNILVSVSGSGRMQKGIANVVEIGTTTCKSRAI